MRFCVVSRNRLASPRGLWWRPCVRTRGFCQNPVPGKRLSVKRIGVKAVHLSYTDEGRVLYEDYGFGEHPYGDGWLLLSIADVREALAADDAIGGDVPDSDTPHALIPQSPSPDSYPPPSQPGPA
jgi:hypothetical protein